MDYSFTKHAYRELRKLPEGTQKRIIQKLRFYLAQEKPMRFADTLEGEQGKIYRFRIGEFRLIFDWHGEEILVTKIALRPNVYRR